MVENKKKRYIFALQKMQLIMSVGAKLKKFRELSGYSQKEIADVLNISQKTYSNIESDKSKVSIEQLAALSLLLDFNFIDFLQEQGVSFNQSNNNFSESNNNENNMLPAKLINQLELCLKENDKIIHLLEELLLSFHSDR